MQLAARIDFELQIGQGSESIEVNASSALLVTDNATVGTVIENKRIVELPALLVSNVLFRFRRRSLRRPGR